MDIDYLVFLQGVREGFFGGAFNNLAQTISDVVTSPLPIMFYCIVFWCVDKRMGRYFFLNFECLRSANSLLKQTFCVYRPWIRDASVIPAGDSMTTATGYSFPSGHSTNATAYFGTLAMWARKKAKWLTAVCIVFILLVMFSRNFLGVHTPQDVLIGFGVSAVIVIINWKVIDWLETENLKRDIIVVIVGLAFGLAMYLYFSLKSYPVDYNEEGKIIADPVKMMVDGNMAVAAVSGFFIGWFVEKNFIKFEFIKDKKVMAIFVILAVIPIFYWHDYFSPFGKATLGDAATKFLITFVEYIYVFIIVPLIINFINKRIDKYKALDKPKTNKPKTK